MVYKSCSVEETEKIAFENYLKKLEDGEQSALVGNLVMDSIKMQDYASSAHQMLTDLIEVEQYLKASWLRLFGMNENFNMKRESIMGDEASMGEDSIMTLLQDMLNQRKIACEKINKIFNLNVSVHFSNIFENNLVTEEVAENDGEANFNETEGNSDNTETISDSSDNISDVNSTEQNQEQEPSENSEVAETSEEEVKEADVEININIDSAEEVVTEDDNKEEEEKEDETE